MFHFFQWISLFVGTVWKKMIYGRWLDPAEERGVEKRNGAQALRSGQLLIEAIGATSFTGNDFSSWTGAGISLHISSELVIPKRAMSNLLKISLLSAKQQLGLDERKSSWRGHLTFFWMRCSKKGECLVQYLGCPTRQPTYSDAS